MKRCPMLLLLLAAACASTDDEERSPAPVAFAAEPTPAAEALPDRPDLAWVVTRVEDVPLLAAHRLAVARQEGGREQASLLPDPVLTLRQANEPSDFSDGFARTVVRLLERIETAGKRSARTRIAEGRVREAEVEERSIRITLARAAAEAHQTALALEGLVAVRRESVRAADELLDLRRGQVEAGRAEEASLLPLRERAGRLRLSLAEEERRRRVALRDLEGLLAVPPGSFTGVSGTLLSAAELPPAATDEDLLKNPGIEASAASEETARASLEAAESGAWPDVTLGVEWERIRQPSERTQTLGLVVEVPVPVFDRKQGDIRAANAEIRRARALREDARLRAGSTYASALERIRSHRERIGIYRDEVIPAAEGDLRIAEARRQEGRADREAELVSVLALADDRAAVIREEAGLAIAILDALEVLGRTP